MASTNIGIIGTLFENGEPIQSVAEMNIADNLNSGTSSLKWPQKWCKSAYQLNHMAYGAGSGGGGYRRISSKYIVPEPPANGLFLLPRPREIVSTLVRFTPWSANACRSIVHSVQVVTCAAQPFMDTPLRTHKVYFVWITIEPPPIG